MKQFVIYLAGKVPKSDEELKNYSDWRAEFERAAKQHGSSVICIDPTHIHFDISDVYGIFGRDAFMVKQSDFVVVDARGRIGPGTAQEMLIAKYFGKPVITILPKNSHYWKDTKIRGKEAKAWMNPFIAATSDIFAETIDEAAKKISECINNSAWIRAKNIRLIDDAINYYASNLMHKDAGAKRMDAKPDESQIILASKSNGRAKILREAGFAVETVPSAVDESKIRDKSPEELVKKLALAKAENVAVKADAKAIVTGADTVCVFGGKIIEKPKDKNEALKMLSAFSGKTHMLMTGIAVVCRDRKKSIADVSVSTVTFRKLSNAEIEEYLKTDDALNFAGGYNIEGTKSMRFIEAVSGSYSGIIGMPLDKLIPMLRKCGAADF